MNRYARSARGAAVGKEMTPRWVSWSAAAGIFIFDGHRESVIADRLWSMATTGAATSAGQLWNWSDNP
jgi:hypothetical protein